MHLCIMGESPMVTVCRLPACLPICMPGVLEAQVGNEAQLVQVMQTGLASRTVAGTRCT
jgi:hypothetical protein